MPRSAANTPCGVADAARSAANTATITPLTSFLEIFENLKVFSAFLGAKKHFFQKVLRKWSSIPKKIENIFITF